MINTLSRKAAFRLYSSGAIEEADQELYEYALNVALNGIIHFATCTALGAAFGLIPASLALFISFSVIRKFAGGFHASTPLRCYLFSVAINSLLLALVKFISYVPIWLLCTLLAVLALPVFFMAPADTEAKPLSAKEKKLYHVVSVFLYAVSATLSLCAFFFLSEEIGFAICLGLCLQGFVLILAWIGKRVKLRKLSKSYCAE